jgi:thiol-disulfide isomerase/thioredoxin
MRRAAIPMILIMVMAACGGSISDGESESSLPDLPTTTAAEFERHLAGVDRPAVVNVWASWCLPCRSEAPLLNTAFAKYGSQIEFIGVDVQDNQTDAKAFLEEFGLDFDHFFDRGRLVPNSYGGIGTPITFFFGPDGELVSTHNGVVDDRTLALNIDELLALSD